MKAFFTGAVFLVGAILAAPAFAQPGMGAGVAVSGYGPYYPNFSGTPAGNFLQGRAEVIRSEGIYNQLSGQAAVEFAQARTISIENSRKWLQAYFDLRQLNREQQAAMRGPPPTYSFLIRSAQEAAPRRLSPYEFDASTGQINWPLALQSDAFAGYRGQLEQLFAFRASAPQRGAAFDTYMDIWQTADKLVDALQSYITQLPPQEYVAGKRFLQSLAWEASQPVLPAPKEQAVGSILPPTGPQAIAPPPIEKVVPRVAHRE